MDKRKKLRTDLERYRTLRDLIADERATAAIDEAIREAEAQLAEIEASAENGAEPNCGH
jgi:hypothetical protein